MNNVSETALGVAEAKLQEINKSIPHFKFELQTVIQAILSVSEMHMGTQNLPEPVEAALAKINESGKLLNEIVGDTLTKLEKHTETSKIDIVPKTEPAKKIDRQPSERRVVPVKMPYGSVMIVDDLELNLRVTKGLLEFYDVNVDTALCAQSVIDKVISGAVYDIILMDLMMPDIDGITAMHTLRKLGYAMPIVAFTANSSPEHDEACLAQGFDYVLGKPIKVPELDDVLHKFIRNRQSAKILRKAEANEDPLSKVPDTQKEMADFKGCILLVGEDVELLSSVSRVLSKLYNVKATRKIKDAITIAVKHDVDLILLDVSVANDEGYKILEEIKSNEKLGKLPVIVVSKDSMVSDEARALIGGAVDFLRKPFKDNILALRVELHMQLLKQVRDIEYLSMIDSLTGINNRRSYNIVFENEWKRAARTRTHLSLLMIDIDHFKLFNDINGHLCGDEVLKSIARVLVSTVKRGSDYVFRWGGEEFAVILPDTPLEGAYFVAESIRRNIENTAIKYTGKSHKVTVSIGASSVIPDYSTFDCDSYMFISIVDKALYAAKDQGRNRVVKLVQ